ncbi:serine/threonine-protein kinase [Amycolatopsis viridis]|uniref:non-specific serine/threonine protein kinase n=1 Tax=Amycolatopsis viridis TaxID=185678 RepID=A0ABX0T0S4_9PSEU|nr:serine/threonine-protein kinase [Amycolatopsis viridis]NIH81772.1 serine/threonine protein kinase [Amycolatopsis viridis]
METGERYRLEERIGGGGSADVHRAWDSVAGREVAIKIFPAGATRTQQRRQAQEFRILDRLRHPALVPLYDSGVRDGRPFFVMRLVDGPTLAERIAEGPLTVDETIELGARLADALAYVHRAGITHRDVKPANVLLSPDGAVLGDFGIAQGHDSTRFTTTGTVVGTAAYMAPEQVRGDQVGPAADVYSLALVLLECLSGRREYPGSLTESAVARLLRPPVVPDGLPAHVADLLRRMGDRDPQARPPAHEVAAVLSGVTRPLPRTRPRRRLRVAAGFASTAAAAACSLVLLGGATAEAPASAPAPAVAAPVVAPPMTSDAPAPVVDTAPARTEAAPVAPQDSHVKGNPGNGNGNGKAKGQHKKPHKGR